MLHTQAGRADDPGPNLITRCYTLELVWCGDCSQLASDCDDLGCLGQWPRREMGCHARSEVADTRPSKRNFSREVKRLAASSEDDDGSWDAMPQCSCALRLRTQSWREPL